MVSHPSLGLAAHCDSVILAPADQLITAKRELKTLQYQEAISALQQCLYRTLFHTVIYTQL